MNKTIAKGQERGSVSLRTQPRVVVWFVLLVLLTVVSSYLRERVLVGRDEILRPSAELLVREGMTVGDFGKENGLERPMLRGVFDLKDMSQLRTPLADFGMSRDELEARVLRARALRDEGESKDWAKIRLKFALWIAVLVAAFALMRRRLVTRRVRMIMYALSVVIFGIVLGSDPSPMGTVKDAIALYGSVGIIFPPRAIALGIFLLMVILANKFICAWGCQFGVLQDLILRLRCGRPGSPQPWKPRFAVTNTVRILFFAALGVVAFAWAYDIVEPIDPFKIYKPEALTIAGMAFLFALLVASLFMYRPWCHLFCPFGLVGWVVEMISLFKIKVDYDACIACEACEKACPSTVMGAILKRDRVIPDCFACGTCIGACPVDAIHLGAGRRARPPEGKFRPARPSRRSDDG